MTEKRCHHIGQLLVWKDFTILKRLGGQPIFSNIAHSHSLLTRSKALVRSMKSIYKGTFCSLHFSYGCRTKKIMSVVERWDLNPHCDLDIHFRPTSVGEEGSSNDLPAIPSRQSHLWSLQSDLAPLFLLVNRTCIDETSPLVCRHCLLHSKTTSQL